jgi:2-C-methyl-D-erythritol 4-phosphate cytidylyltransferase
MIATAVIVAAGGSVRMGNSGDKLFTDLCGKPVLLYSIEAFQKAKSIDSIIVVCSDVDRVRDLCEAASFVKIVGVVKGGNNRSESVLCGLNSIKSERGIVAIHDGARPLVTPELIDRAVSNFPSVPCIPVRDTIKIVENEYIKSTPARENLYAAQTPQVFDLRTCKRVAGSGLDVTDDSMLMEHIGVKVKIIEGDECNIKITTPQDLIIARELLRLQKGSV